MRLFLAFTKPCKIVQSSFCLHILLNKSYILLQNWNYDNCNHFSLFYSTFVMWVCFSSGWLFLLLIIVKTEFIPLFFGHQTLLHSTAQIVLGLQPADGRRALVLTQADHVLEVGGLAFAVVVQWKWSLLRRRPFELLCPEHIGSHREMLLFKAWKVNGTIENH